MFNIEATSNTRKHGGKHLEDRCKFVAGGVELVEAPDHRRAVCIQMDVYGARHFQKL
ncbi:hypothetical protein FOZ63_011540 [Perkinsus olseni]|uniref:Uncharacterized protein n=2 Tax=Perkinsus olseni TaxID=32597 RepID=A0A7J6PTX1_PEROL|nr:hypothetical protein FOZ63_011540 [Perkinsus olseni]